MNNINWANIAKLNDFSKYLDNEELIQLSMSSSKVRSHYSNEIVKCFNFSPFVDHRGYKSTLISEKYDNFYGNIYDLSNPYIPLTRELIESKSQFGQDMKMFKRDLEKIVVHNSIEYSYLLYEIPAIFPNIKTLAITNSALKIELLQYLLDNLKYLENLDVCENMLIHSNEGINNYTIEWPNSLTCLKLCGNMVINTEDRYSNIVIKQIQYDNSKTGDLYPPSKHLPNLATFEYRMHGYYSSDLEDQIQFFHLNNHLKVLKLSVRVDTYKILNIIGEYENLTYLEYKCVDCDEYIHGYIYGYIEEYDNPALPSVSHLHILDNFMEDHIYIDMFPNVTDLIVEYSSTDYQRDLENIIKNFPKLKTLKLIFNSNLKEVFDLTLPKLNYLKEYEINLNYEGAKLEDFEWELSACDKLKLLTFTKTETCTPFENSEVGQEITKNWDYLYFSHKLVFHKKL